MSGITRYLLRQIAAPALFFALALAGVVWLTQSLRFIDRIISQAWPLERYLYVTVLLLPGALTIVLPIALFCATFYAYHRLASESELVVMAAAGVGRMSLAKPALITAAGVGLLMYVLLLYLAPLGGRTFRILQIELSSEIAGILLREGVFNSPAPGLTVYVRSRAPNGDLLGILVHDNRVAARPVTMMAERGALVRAADGPRFVLANGNRQQIDQGRRSLSLLYFDSHVLDLNQYAPTAAALWLQADERYLHELFWPNMESSDDRKNYDRLIVEGHRRLATPLLAPAMALLALLGVIGGDYNRRGGIRRVIAAAAAAVALQAVYLAVIQLAGKNLLLAPALYLVPIAAIAAAAAILLRQRRRVGAAPSPAGGA
jgi:lipopolysaccharide export system permease protein